MPRGYQQPWPAAVGFESAQPPPDDIQHPDSDQRVIDIKPTTPVQAKHLIGLTGRVAVSGPMTPPVVKMESAYYVGEQTGARDSPSQPRRRVPLISFPRKCKHGSPAGVPRDGDPDCD